MYPKIRALWALSKDGYLAGEGWFQSFSSRNAVNANGSPIPWINYSMLHFLIPRMKNDISMLEYGGGNSTLFWAGRVLEIVTVEHDLLWAHKISEKIAAFPNASLLVAPDGPEYENAPSKLQKKFDMIVIDGIRRTECVSSAVSMLTPSGCVLLDDSHLAEQKPIFEIMASYGFKALRISGAKPIQNDFSEATIFYRLNNVLEI